MNPPENTPANVMELYERLRDMGYRNDGAEKAWQSIEDLAVRDALELDRREVFRVWYDGRQEATGVDGPSLRLSIASEQYAAGILDSCIDYILTNP